MKALLDAYDVWKIVKKLYKDPRDEATLPQTQNDILKGLRKRDKCNVCQGNMEEASNLLQGFQASQKDVSPNTKRRV